MSKTVAQASADYRARRAAKLSRIEGLKAGHRAILAKLAGNDKTLAATIRAISQEALGDDA